MENKKILLIVVAFMLIQCFITGILIFRSINQDNELEANMGILQDFSSGMKIIDKKITETMYAHNREVESWYVGNKYLEDTTKKFFSAMHTLSKEGNMTEFETCIADYEDYYSLLTPHMEPNGDVDGYIIWMHESKDFNEIGFMLFAKEYAKYVVYPCGGYYYNKTTDDLIFVAPEVLA